MSGKPDAKCEPHEDAAQSGTAGADRIDAQDPGSRFRPPGNKNGTDAHGIRPVEVLQKAGEDRRLAVGLLDGGPDDR